MIRIDTTSYRYRTKKKGYITKEGEGTLSLFSCGQNLSGAMGIPFSRLINKIVNELRLSKPK